MAKTIKITSLRDDRFPIKGVDKTDWVPHSYVAARVDDTSNTRVYLKAYNERGQYIADVAKQMRFEGGNIYISGGSKKIKIGTYKAL